MSKDVDPELAGLALAGAVFYRRLMTDATLQTTEVDPLIDSVLGTLNAPSVQERPPGRVARNVW